MHDQAIIEMIRTDRSDKALDALYKCLPPIRKHIRNNGGNRQDAEDIFQEALIILCRKVRETDFVLTAKLSTYLFSVCQYLWKDEVKKRKYLVTSELSDTALAVGETDVENEQAARLAEQVLAELGDRCRELLMYYYNARMKLKDIAVKMGYSSENTAKNQKYKCLETAKKKLCVTNSK